MLLVQFSAEKEAERALDPPPPSFSGRYCSSVSSLTPKRETEVLEICSSIPRGDFCQSAPVSQLLSDAGENNEF